MRSLVMLLFTLVPAIAAAQSAVDRCGLRTPRVGAARLRRPAIWRRVLSDACRDPKGLHSFLSYQRTIGDDDSLSTIGSVGIGDQFGLARWGGSKAGNGVQLSLSGAVFSVARAPG